MRWSRLWLVSCALLAACGDGCGERATAAGPEERTSDAAPAPIPIAPGQTIELALAQGDQRRLELAALPEGHAFAELVVEQRGVDVRVLLTAGGEPLLEVDAAPGRAGAERVPWLVADGRDLALTVHAQGLPEPDGRAAVSLVTAAAPTPEQDARARATALEHRAHKAALDAGDALADAERDWLAAAALWESLGDRRRQARALDRTGRVLDLRGDNTGALETRRRALAIQEEIGDRAGQAISLVGTGSTLSSLGQIEGSMAALERGSALCRELGLPATAAMADYNLAALHIELGELEPGLAVLERAQRTFERLGQLHSVAIVLFQSGRASELLGDPEAARGHYERARAILREHNLIWDEGSAAYLLGILHASQLGDLERGAALLDEALALQRRANNRRGAVNTVIARSWVRLLQGRAADARDGFLEARDAAAEMNEHLLESELSLGLGEAHRALGDAPAALAEQDAALAAAQRLGSRLLEARALSARARTLAALGRDAEALDAARRAIDVAESLRAELAMQSRRAGFFASVREHHDVLIELLLARGDDDAVREAFAVSERARARALVESLRTAELEESVDAALAAELRQHARALRSAEQRFAALIAGGATEPERAAAERAIAGAVRAAQRARDRLRRQSPAFADLVDPTPAPLAAIQRALPAGALLLEYSFGDRAGFVWAVTRDAVTVTSVPPRREIEARTRSAIAALTARNREGGDPDAAATDAALAALSNALLEPVAGLLTAERIYVVADGAAHYVPFAALPVPGESVPLVERAEIAMLPRASMLVDPPRQRRRPTGAPVAVLADPVFSADDARLAAPRASADPGYPRLRFSRHEAESIAALIDGALVSLDTDASQERAQSDAVAAARVVHVATHGLLDTGEPALSALVLSLVDERGAPRDGLLRLHEIYRLRLAAELVVLSGCETALGKRIRGEGVVGLTRGFLYAGADRVLASLWQIHDRATAELMRHFYRALLVDGLSAPAALRRAQRAMRADERWRAPYYWAPFVLHAQSP